jgi:tetratricopeptide (TPR) repeat protein
MPTTWSRASRIALVVVVAALGAAARADEKSAPLLDEARHKLRLRDVPGALKFLDAAVRADPQDADAQILYQDLLRRDKPAKALLAQYTADAARRADDPLAAFLATRLLKPEDAAPNFAGQVHKFPSSAWPHEGRAAALDALGKFKEASAEHDAAVSASPREPRFRVSQARSFEHAGQWAQAAEIWRLAVGLRPSDRSLILGLGEALRRGRVLDEAIAQFEAAGKLDPSDPEPQYRIGLARSDGGTYDDALKCFNAAIALDKGYIDAYCAAVRTSVTRARDIAQKGKRDLVEADFTVAIDYGTRAIQADGMNPSGHLALANAEEAAAEVASAHGTAALREYDAALNFLAATNPDRIRGLVGRAYVLLLNGSFDDAIAAAEKAIDQDDHAVTAYLTAGRATAGKGNPDDAIKNYYVPGLKIAPDDAALRHARGISLWENQKWNDAKKDLEFAAQAEPKNGRYQLSLGEFYYFQKMYKQAETVLVAAADLRPRDAATWRALGRTETSLKNYEPAAAAFEEVVRLVEGDAAPAPGGAGGPAAPGTPPAPGAPAPTPPAPGTQPPATPPAPANPQPPAPSPPAPTPPAPTPPAGDPPPAPPPGTPPAPAAAPAPKFATDEHLYLALLYADFLKQKDKAKVHAKKWVDQGGKNQDLDSWVQNLLADK